MNKKNYQNPQTQTYHVQTQSMMAGTNVGKVNSNVELNSEIKGGTVVARSRGGNWIDDEE